MSKKNPNLTVEQKLVMFEDGTEPSGTSELNNEKRNGSYHLICFQTQKKKLLLSTEQIHHYGLKESHLLSMRMAKSKKFIEK